MRDPEASLLDIVTYARRAITYLKGVNAGEFAASTGVQDQVIRCLTVIGEAARRTPEQVRIAYPRVPWALMVSMRNRLAHEYDGVDADTVWLTVTRDLPEILAEIEEGPSDPTTRSER